MERININVIRYSCCDNCYIAAPKVTIEAARVVIIGLGLIFGTRLHMVSTWMGGMQTMPEKWEFFRKTTITNLCGVKGELKSAEYRNLPFEVK